MVGGGGYRASILLQTSTNFSHHLRSRARYTCTTKVLWRPPVSVFLSFHWSSLCTLRSKVREGNAEPIMRHESVKMAPRWGHLSEDILPLCLTQMSCRMTAVSACAAILLGTEEQPMTVTMTTGYQEPCSTGLDSDRG